MRYEIITNDRSFLMSSEAHNVYLDQEWGFVGWIEIFYKRNTTVVICKL